MARVLKDNAWCGTGAIDLKHILFENEEFPPQLFDIVLDGGANGPKVIEPCTATINFESLEENISPFDKIIQEFFIFEQFLKQ